MRTLLSSLVTFDGVSPRRLARVLGGTLVGMGVLHFLAPRPFDQIVPPEIPGEPRTLTYASGAAEIAIGGTLLNDRTRRLGGGLAAALFVAVYPANINMVRLWWRKPLPYKLIALARLPFQVPMVAAAVKIARSPH